MALAGCVLCSPQAFGTLRLGRRLTSRRWRGFRLFDEPSYMFGFGYAHLYMPWEVWEVKPTRLLRYEATAVPDFAGRQLRARSIEVVQRMPAGFEYGPNGGTVRRLVEKLAQVPQRPPTGHRGNPDYEIAMTLLEDQCFQTGRLHDSRVALAAAYLDCLASRSHTGPIGRWNRHLPASTPVSTLLNSAVAGLPVPDLVAQRWCLAPDREPQTYTAT